MHAAIVDKLDTDRKAASLRALLDAGAEKEAKRKVRMAARARFFCTTVTAKKLEMVVILWLQSPARYHFARLCQPCSGGNIDFECLIWKGLMCATQGGGYTALMYAARYGNPAALKLLLDAGADRDATDDVSGLVFLVILAWEVLCPLALYERTYKHVYGRRVFSERTDAVPHRGGGRACSGGQCAPGGWCGQRRTRQGKVLCVRSRAVCVGIT